MNPCIANVRKHVEKTCEELFKEIPNLKVGFISHGDYCDGDNCYATQILTDDQTKVFNFIRNTPSTSGGDAPECYELALNLAKTLGWSDKKGGKVVVMIGDAEPHDVNYPQNKDKLDWRKELADLKAMGINVYPLQCLYNANASGPNAFWTAIGETMDTPLLKLQNFDEASQALRSFAHASAGSASYAAYEKKLELCGTPMSANIRCMNSTLRDEATRYDVIEEVPFTDEVPATPPTPPTTTVKEKKPRGRPKKNKL
jgi:hypothetical protein